MSTCTDGDESVDSEGGVVGEGTNNEVEAAATDVCFRDDDVGELMGECITNIICFIKPSREAGTERAVTPEDADEVRDNTGGTCSRVGLT